MNEERERLIEEFDLLWKKKPIAFYENLADWVIADRERIVAPLNRWITDSKYPSYKAVQETLKLAGG